MQRVPIIKLCIPACGAAQRNVAHSNLVTRPINLVLLTVHTSIHLFIAYAKHLQPWDTSGRDTPTRQVVPETCDSMFGKSKVATNSMLLY